MVSWCSRKHAFVSLSIAEAEYILVCMEVREAVWIWKLLAGLFGKMSDPTVIHCDNQSCVKLSENPVYHDISKHVEIKFHYIQDMVLRKSILMQYLPTEEKIAYVLTKPLAKSKFEYFRDKTWSGRECPSR
jgi:hypothetical protein